MEHWYIIAMSIWIPNRALLETYHRLHFLGVKKRLESKRLFFDRSVHQIGDAFCRYTRAIFSTCGKSRVWGRHAANVGLQTKMLASWPLACGQHQLSEDKDTNYAQNVLKQCPIWCSKCVTEVPLPEKMGLLTNTWVAFVNNLKYLFIIDVSATQKSFFVFCRTPTGYFFF